MAVSPAPSSTHRWPKRLLFAGLFALLVLPALQAKFNFVAMPELGGYAERAPRADFSLEELKNSTFQPALEKYLDDRIGFREWMIQLRNQLAYSVFNAGRANNTVLGKDDILFDGNAIETYLGNNFVGEKEVAQNTRHFKDVQDTLASHSTLLVFAIAPSKADIYQDMWPDYYKTLPRRRSTYQAYVEKMTAAGINLIDFGAVFHQWKDTSAYPLFPRGGIHWSLWGRDLAVDTLFRYIRQHGNPSLPNCRITSREFSTEPRDTDDDIAKALNLMKAPKTYLMAYPQMTFDTPKPDQKKPNMLLIADSFGYGLVPYLPLAFNTDSRFWYYNSQVAWAGTGDPPEGNEVSSYDYRAQMKGRDVVLILFTEPNLDTFDHGFSNTLYKLYHPYGKAEDARMKDIQQQMLNDTTTANRIWRQAYKDGIDPKFIFYREAQAILDKER